MASQGGLDISCWLSERPGQCGCEDCTAVGQFVLEARAFVAAELTFPHVSSGSLGQSGLPLYVSALARPHAVDVDDVHTLLSSCVVHPVMVSEQLSENEIPGRSRASQRVRCKSGGPQNFDGPSGHTLQASEVGLELGVI